MNWGFIGFGRIAHKFLSSLRLVEGQCVKGIATFTNAHNAEAVCPDATIYGNYDDLLADSNIDIVYISTTHNFHVENAIAALKAGKHVLCEKPMGLSAEDLLKIERVPRKTFIMEALWTRFLPAYQQMKTWLRQGEIGEVVLVKADFGFASTLPPNGRLLSPQLAGGAMYDVGIYPLSLAQDVFEHRLPQGHDTHIIHTKSGVDGSISYQLNYGEGKVAQLFASITSDTPKSASIIGTKGRIDIPMFWKPQEVILVKGSDSNTKYLPFVNTGYYHEILEVINCIKNGKMESEIMPLRHSKQLAYLMETMLNSKRIEV